LAYTFLLFPPLHNYNTLISYFREFLTQERPKRAPYKGGTVFSFSLAAALSSTKKGSRETVGRDPSEVLGETQKK